MKIQIYVTKDAGVTPEQMTWAQITRSKGHRVHFCLDDPFRKTEECDAYIADEKSIVEAYKAVGIPAFEESMLEENKPVAVNTAKDKRPKKASKKPADIVIDMLPSLNEGDS